MSVSTINRNLTTKNKRVGGIFKNFDPISPKNQEFADSLGTLQPLGTQFKNKVDRPQTTLQSRDRCPLEMKHQKRGRQFLEQKVEMPEETVSFNERVASQNSRDKQPEKKAILSPKPHRVIQVLQSPTSGDMEQQPSIKIKRKKGIFAPKNISIKSKPRIVDATMTAYKLLESAFINQAGNPNNLQEKFNQKLSKKTVYKEVFGERPKSKIQQIKQQQITFSPKSTVLSPKSALSNFVSPKSEATTQKKAVISESVAESSTNQQPSNKPLPPILTTIQPKKQRPLVIKQKDIVIKKQNLMQQETPKLPETTPQRPKTPQQITNTVKDLSDVIRERGPVSVKPKKEKKKKIKKSREFFERRNQNAQQINERLYEMLEQVTMQREQLEQMKAPMFSSNHIQNLTINAQNGLNQEQIQQIQTLTQQLNAIQQQISRQQQQEQPSKQASSKPIQQPVEQMDMFSLPPSMTPNNDRETNYSLTNKKSEKKSSIPLEKPQQKPSVEQTPQVQKQRYRKFRSQETTNLKFKKKGQNSNKTQTTESKKSHSKSPVSGMTQAMMALGDRDSSLSKNDAASSMKHQQEFLMPPGGKTISKDKLTNICPWRDKNKNGSLIYLEEVEEKKKLIRAQTQNSNKQRGQGGSNSSSLSPNTGSASFSLQRGKPKFMVQNLSQNEKKSPGKTLKKMKTLKKRADTLEEEKIECIKVPDKMDRYGNKLAKYGKGSSPSQSKIENSLKISQNLSNSNRRADFDNNKQLNQSNEKLVEVLQQRIAEIKELSEGIKSQQNLKEVMKKMIDEMSEEEMNKLLVQRSFKLDLDNDNKNQLRIQSKNPKDSSDSNTIKDLPMVDILDIKKLDSSRSQPGSKKSGTSILSKITTRRSALSQRSFENGKLQLNAVSEQPPQPKLQIQQKEFLQDPKGSVRSRSKSKIKITQRNLSSGSGSGSSIMIMQSSNLGSCQRGQSKPQIFKQVQQQESVSSSSNSPSSSSSDLEIHKMNSHTIQVIQKPVVEKPKAYLQLNPQSTGSNLIEGEIEQINSFLNQVSIEQQIKTFKKFETVEEATLTPSSPQSPPAIRDLKKQGTDPVAEQEQPKSLRKFYGAGVRETQLEKFLSFINKRDLQTKTFVNNKTQLNLRQMQEQFSTEDKDDLLEQQQLQQNKIDLKLAIKNTSQISGAQMLKKNLALNLKVQIEKKNYESNHVQIDQETLEKIRVLTVVKDLQDDIDLRNLQQIKNIEFQERSVKLHSTKVCELLIEMHGSGGQQQLNFVSNFTSTELKHKLIEIYDLKTSGMIDIKVRHKFIRNKKFIESVLRQEEEERIRYEMEKQKKAKLLRSSSIHIDNMKDALLVNIGAFIFQDQNLKPKYQLQSIKINFEELEQELRIRLKESDVAQIEYKRQRSYKVRMQQMKIQDDMRYQQYMSYIDHVWKTNANKLAFITTNDTQILDNMSYKNNVTFKGIKQITETLKIYNFFNWPLIQETIQRYHHKYQFKNFFFDQFLSKKKLVNEINQVIDMKLNVVDDIYNIGGESQIYWPPNNNCMDMIYNRFKQSMKPRISPVIFKQIINVVNQSYMDYINQEKLEKCFSSLIKYLSFHSQHSSLENYKNQVQTKLEAENLPTSFNQYYAFHVLKSQQNFYQILFMHKMNSLYENLYDVEQDYELLNLIDQIFINQKFQFFNKYKALSSKDPNNLTHQEYEQLCHMENTLNTFDNGLQPHHCHGHGHEVQQQVVEKASPEEVLQKQFGNEYDLDFKMISQQIGRVSNLLAEKTVYTQQKDFFLRQNALDKFNVDSIEFQVLYNLDQTQTKVKKKVSLYYKRVEPILDLKDPDLNCLCQIFSYKCTLIRDEKSKYLMEIFEPIQTSKGNENVRIKDQILRNPKNYKEYQQILQLIDQTKKAPKRDKMFSALQVEELHTDESMEQINIFDIQSDAENISQSAVEMETSSCTKTRRSARKHKEDSCGTSSKRAGHNKSMIIESKISNLENMKTPLEHYKTLRKQRDQNFLTDGQNIDAIKLLDRVAETMKPRQNVYKVLNQEQIIENETNLTNIFKQLKKKYKIERMVRYIQKGVDQDNAKHYQSLEKQRKEIQRQREQTDAKLNTLGLFNKKKKMPQLRLSDSSSYDEDDESSISNSSDEKSNKSLAQSVKKTQFQLNSLNKAKETARKLSIRENSSSLNSSRRRGFQVNEMMDIFQQKMQAEIELQKLKIKEYDLKKAMNMMEKNKQTFNIEVKNLSETNDDQKGFQDSFKNLFTKCISEHSHAHAHKSGDKTHEHDHTPTPHDFTRMIEENKIKFPDNNKMELLQVPQKKHPIVEYTESHKHEASLRGSLKKQMRSIEIDKKQLTVPSESSLQKRRLGESDVESRGILDQLQKQTTLKLNQSGSESSEFESTFSSKIALKQAGIQDIMNKLKFGIKRRLESNLSVLYQKQSTKHLLGDKPHDHGHDHEHEHNHDHDSGSDLESGKELAILQEIKSIKNNKKKMKLRQQKKRELIFQNLETPQNKFARSKEQKVNPKKLVKKATFDNQKKDQLKKLQQQLKQRNELIVKKDQENYSGERDESSPMEQFNKVFKGMIQGETPQQEEIALQVQRKLTSQLSRTTELTFSSAIVELQSQHKPEACTVSQVSKKLQLEQQALNLERARASDIEMQTRMFTNRMNQAILTRNTGLMEDILRRYQGDIDVIEDEDGNSLLIMAAMNGDFKMCEILLSRGVNVNAQNHLGNTALHYAIMKKYNKTIDILISYDVNENIENYMGIVPWQMA